MDFEEEGPANMASSLSWQLFKAVSSRALWHVTDEHCPLVSDIYVEGGRNR